MALYYAPTARRASYASPPHFPGGTLARGTPTRMKRPGWSGQTQPGRQRRERSKCLVHSL